MNDLSTTSIRRNLALLWAGQFVSAVGDAALYAALLFLVLALEPVRGATKSGIVALAETLPYLLFGLMAGAVVDRSRRIRLMIGADLGRAAVLMLIPILFWLGGLSWASLAAVAFQPDPPPGMVVPLPNADSVDFVLQGRVLPSEADPADYVVASAPVGATSGLLTVQVATRLSDVNRSMTVVRFALWTAVPTLVAAVGMGSWVMTRRSLEPVAVR